MKIMYSRVKTPEVAELGDFIKVTHLDGESNLFQILGYNNIDDKFILLNVTKSVLNNTSFESPKLCHESFCCDRYRAIELIKNNNAILTFIA